MIPISNVALNSCFSFSRGKFNTIRVLFYNAFICCMSSTSFAPVFFKMIEGNRASTLIMNRLLKSTSKYERFSLIQLMCFPSNTTWDLVLIWIFNKHHLGEPLFLDYIEVKNRFIPFGLCLVLHIHCMPAFKILILPQHTNSDVCEMLPEESMICSAH